MNKTGIGEKLRDLMDSDLSVQGNENALARRSGVPQPTIHRILTGESQDPRRSTIEKIASYFGVAADDFYKNAPIKHGGVKEDSAEAQYHSTVKRTAEQEKLVKLYDAASPKVKMAIMVLLEREAEHMEAGLPKLETKPTPKGKTSGNRQ